MKFVVGKEYRRAKLHDDYGGSRQGGIGPSSQAPLVFLFTGQSGEMYGYHDGPQPDGLYWYTGEGQVGDMQMVRGNRAIEQSGAAKRALHLFEEVRSAWVRYLGEMVYVDHHIGTAPDRDGKERKVIVFHLAFAAETQGPATGEPAEDARKEERSDPVVKEVSRLSTDKLRELALRGASEVATVKERKVLERKRSAAVKLYVLRRAGGKCEACEKPAPFKTKAGQPYLEPHHIRRLADEGPDHPAWVAALCPTCHREVHHGAGGDALIKTLAPKIQALEAVHDTQA